MQLWQAALSTLNPNPTDSCPLYLNCATVAALPSRVSRHNSPSAAHFITRLVRTCLPPGTHRCILVSASERGGPTRPLLLKVARGSALRSPVLRPTVSQRWTMQPRSHTVPPALQMGKLRSQQ